MPNLKNDDELARVRELLPWFANGSLNDADSRWVSAWLAAHPEETDVHAELAWLKQSALQYKNTVETPAADKGLDVLLARIHAEKATAAQRRAVATDTSEDLWTKLKSWFATPAFGLSMAALLLVQTGVIGLLMRHTPAPTETPSSSQSQTMTPLSGGQVAAPAGMALLQVTFLPTATERDIRATLNNAQAQIISGPSSLGVYVLAVPAAELEKSQNALRGQSQVIESVSRP